MKLTRINLLDILVGLAVLGIIAMAGLGAYYQASCKTGHTEFTGNVVCMGEPPYLVCGPEKRFVCDDRR